MRTRPGVVLLVVAGAALAARAEDRPASADLRQEDRWKKGDVVSASVSESTTTTLRATAGDDDAPAQSGTSGVAATFVQTCLEATDDGRLVRSLLRIDEFSASSLTQGDCSLAGAVVETTPRGWRLLSASSNPSRWARKWLDNRFGPGGMGFSGGLSELGAPASVTKGASWEAAPPAIPKLLVQGGLGREVADRKWTFRAEDVAPTDAGVSARVAFEETFPVSGSIRVGGLPLSLAEGSTARVGGSVEGVPGLWHRTGRMRTASTGDFRCEAGGAEIWFTIEGEEQETWDAGGEPPVLDAVPGVALGEDERWTAGAVVVEQGSEERTTRETPVDDATGARAAAASRETVTWTAAIRCDRTSDDGSPSVLVLTMERWRRTSGADADDSLAGAVVRMESGRWRVTDDPGRASDDAKEWLAGRLGPAGARDDGLRAAVSPAMCVTPGRSWECDPEAVVAGIRSRFDFPVDADSIEAKGTLASLDGAGVLAAAAVGYEVRAKLSCVPGCAPPNPGAMKGHVRITGRATGPVGSWARLGALGDTSHVEVAVPYEDDAMALRAVVIDSVRTISRSPLSDAEAEARAATAEAVALAAKKDWDAAAEALGRAIDTDPSHARAWFHRGRVRRAQGDHAAAIVDLTRAVELDPECTQAFVLRALSHGTRSEFDRAIADWSRALDLAPRTAVAWRNRGLCLHATGDLAGAAADFTRLIDLLPKDADAHYRRGNVRSALGDDRGALEDFSRAHDLAPREAEYLVARAGAKLDLGETGGAADDCTRALVLAPDDPDTLEGCARIRARCGDTARALADLSKLIGIEPERADAWEQRGWVREDTGDDVGAVADWQRALELDADCLGARRSLARAAFLPGLPAEASVTAWQDVVARDESPDYEHLWLWLVRVRAGHADIATEKLRAFLAQRKAKEGDDWYPSLAGLVAGTVTEETALAAAASPDAKKARERLCEAAFFAGMLRALRGDVAGAVTLYDRSIATDVRNFVEWTGARRWRCALLLGGAARSGGPDVKGRATISGLDPAGPAAKAGLAVGDVVHGARKTPEGAAAALTDVLLAARPGDRVHLDVERRGERLSVEVTLGEWTK